MDDTWGVGGRGLKALYVGTMKGVHGDKYTSIACRNVSAGSSPFSLQSRNFIFTAAIFAAFSTELWALMRRKHKYQNMLQLVKASKDKTNYCKQKTNLE